MLQMVKVGSLELYGLFQNHIFHQTKLDEEDESDEGGEEEEEGEHQQMLHHC